MKKLIAMLITGAITLSALPAHAVKSPSLDFMKASYADSKYSNIFQEGSIEFKLKKPISVLSSLNRFMTENGNTVVDIKALLEGLFESKLSYTAKTKASNGGETISAEMVMKTNAPIKINQNLELDVNTGYSMWFDMMLNENTPKISYIMSSPFSTKYMTFDTDQLIKLMPEEEADELNYTFAILNELLDEENLDEMNDELIESICENASVTGSSKNIKITFDDLGLKKYISDIFEIAFSYYDDEELNKEMLDEVIDNIKDAAVKVPFFEKKALVLNYTLDSKNRIIKQNMELNVDLNLYNLFSALETETPGITEENSRLNFTVAGNTSCKYNVVKITPPSINENNSISLTEQYEQSFNEYEAYPDEAAAEIIYNPYVYIDIDEKLFSEHKYVPLRNLLESFSYEVTYIEGNYGHDWVINCKSDSPYAESKKFSFNSKSISVQTDSMNYVMNDKPVKINGKVYIRLDDAEGLLNFKTENYNYYTYDNSGYISVIRNASEKDFKPISH